MRAITATMDTSVAGYWNVVARKHGAAPLDVTMFRGMPTGVGDFSFDDPFGPKSMSITFPQVTIFDMLGAGDLSWLEKHVDVDVTWDGDLPAAYPFGHQVGALWTPAWRWEGYIASFSYESKGGLSVQLKGALLQLDNYLAKPEFAARPIPYEWAIARQLLDRPALRVAPLRVLWPSWWTKVYQPPPAGTPSYLIPSGVSAGKNWSGLTTRDTGNWDPVLTSYIQTLLASMYTERGRWSIELQTNRLPVLTHRDFISFPDAATVVIDPTSAEVSISLSEDWESSLTTVFGQGSSLAGVAYSGLNISGDGSLTSYAPLAASRQVYPANEANAWFDPSVMVKEVMVQMQSGLDGADAALVARAHLARFLEPGWTGQVVLGSDPSMGGIPLPRHLVRAGMDVHIPYLFGRPEGVLAHVSSSSHSLASGTTTLTVDSKRRDALTVDEVRLRGRDAMAVTRMLIGGQYEPPIPDQLFPWSYAEGSGYLPKTSLALFAAMPRESVFPWASWTAAHPPSSAQWRSCYLRLGPKSSNANNNWITADNSGGTAMGIPIRMAQAGSIRLLQVGAYYADGSVAKIPFHISFYNVSTVNVSSMPEVPAGQEALNVPYLASQRSPFVRDGFETHKIDGTANDPNLPTPIESVGLIKAYGTFYEKAGHWPGSMAEGDGPTGLLVDEDSWPFDLSSAGDAGFDPYHVERNLTNTKAGMIYAMIFADAQTQDVFFLGRLFRAEPTVKGA